ncbi:helix-turn-helix transcriptional regulator [Siccirubricoccus phaeus]|uniref:helix-turn-helix transcriptional regulator n=1 Tax=Siccirubricoccus phaeus TaxID=2595053 RepID=UPI0011F2E511|nr:LuxR C-terminal-related transcriptional regulator [Siccirubricoccus phaeus]
MIATLQDRPRATPRHPAAPLRVALDPPDPALAARLAGQPGLRLEEVDAAAEADVVLAVAGAAGGPPRLVLAEGAAALAALRAGAQGVVPPEASAATIAAALQAVARGLAVLPPALLASRLGAAPPLAGPAAKEAELTRREREVLELLAAGASNKVIARHLGMSFHTAKAHVAAVLAKLGAGSRADAVARAARAGLVLL